MKQTLHYLVLYILSCRIRFGNDIRMDLAYNDADVILRALNFADEISFYNNFKGLCYNVCIGFALKSSEKRICAGVSLSLHAITESE